MLSEEESIALKAERGYWSNHLEYILSMIGYAVGLGNAWRFPYIAYQNGGGAFLIPYFTMIVFLGSSTFFMEVSLGQFSGQSSFQAFSCVPLFRGIGIAVVVAAAYIGIYYNVVIAYAIHYFILSFKSPLPWTTCNHTTSSPFCVETRHGNIDTNVSERIAASENYWENVVLELSSGIEETGKVKVDLLFELMAAWILVGLCTINGVKSVGKAVYFTALFPYIILTVLLIGSLQQEGSLDGIYFLFKPDWTTLGTTKVWLEAANQILLSLSLSIGGLITLSSYNEFHNNCLKDSIIVVLVNTATSLYSGITIFSTLGFMAKKLDLDIKEVVASGPGLAFVVYPEAVSQFGNPQIFSILFFLMLITLGLDTMFAITETVVSTIVDAAPNLLLKNKGKVVVAVCFVLFLLGITIVTQSGFYWLILLDTYAGGYVLLWGGLIEVIVVAHIYGMKRFSEDIEMMLRKKPPQIFSIMLYYITPVIFVALAISSAINYQVLSYKGKALKSWADGVGWLLISSMVAIVLGVAGFEIHNQPGTFLERMKASLKPGKLWRPFKDEDCTGRYALVQSLRITVSGRQRSSSRITTVNTEFSGSEEKEPMFPKTNPMDNQVNLSKDNATVSQDNPSRT